MKRESYPITKGAGLSRDVKFDLETWAKTAKFERKAIED